MLILELIHALCILCTLNMAIKMWQVLGQRFISSQDKGNVVDSDMKIIHDTKICWYASYILHMICTLSIVFGILPSLLKV